MNRKRLWWGTGALCASLAAGVWGTQVFGQPEPPPDLSQSNYAPAVRPIPSAPPNMNEPRQVRFNTEPGALPSAPTVPALPALPNLSPAPPIGTPPISSQPFNNIPINNVPINNAPPTFNSEPSLPRTFEPSKTEPSALPVSLNPANNPGNIDIRPGRQEPAVSVEWINPPNASLGKPMPCQILVKNTGPVAVQQVVVKHRMPTGVTHRASEPSPSIENNQLTWNVGSLEPGQTKKIEVSLIAALKGTLNCQASVTFTAVSAMNVNVREPLLQLKVKGPEKVIAGETATILMHLSNPGDGPAESVKIKVVLPEGLDHSRGRTFEVALENLQPKETRPLQLVCMAKGAGIQQAMFVATADAGLNVSENATLEVLLPKLDIAMIGPKMRYIDRKATYTIKVTNPGTAPATNVTLVEAIPQGLKFAAASSSGQWDENTRNLTWQLGDVPPGQSREVSVDLVAKEPGDHRLAAQVVSAKGTKSDAESRLRVEALSSVLVEVFDADDPLEVGAETTYQVRIKNEGSKLESNVELVCTLPDQVEFRGAKSSGNARFRVEGREVYFEPVSRLTRGSDVIYTIQVRGLQAGTAIFRANVRGEGMDPIVREERTRIYNDDVPAGR